MAAGFGNLLGLVLGWPTGTVGTVIRTVALLRVSRQRYPQSKRGLPYTIANNPRVITPPPLPPTTPKPRIPWRKRFVFPRPHHGIETFRGHHYHDGRGKYRIFRDAGYLLYADTSPLGDVDHDKLIWTDSEEPTREWTITGDLREVSGWTLYYNILPAGGDDVEVSLMWAEGMPYTAYTIASGEGSYDSVIELSGTYVNASVYVPDDEIVEIGTLTAIHETLPATPDKTFSDGTHYLGCTYFNGLIESEFLPIGPAGEPYLILVVEGGAEVGTPPLAPSEWRLELRASGVVRVVGFYHQEDGYRADAWSIAYTTNGSDPSEDSPTVTVEMPSEGMAVLAYDLPAQSNGTTVKVRLQTRRNDGTAGDPDYVYSDGSAIKTTTADASGPSAPPSGENWRGELPAEGTGGVS